MEEKLYALAIDLNGYLKILRILDL